MAKETKKAPTATKSASASNDAPVEGAIDITKLTPAQLAALQKQLKAKGAEIRSKKDERFLIIDTMLKEKDEAGTGFRHTTRDIMNALVKENLVDTTAPEYDKNEIKKIQARKQFLEKQTGKDGQLVHPKGTFGYKPSEHSGFSASPVTVVAWFTPENVAKLTEEQAAAVRSALA